MNVSSRAILPILLVMLATVSRVDAQGRGFFYGRSTGGPYTGGSPGGFGGRSVGGIGGGGPQAFTWYAPGAGYSSNLQTGLPWQSAPGASPRAYALGRDSGSRLGYGVVAREDRAYRRLSTLYAIQRINRERRQEYETQLAARKEKLAAQRALAARKNTPSKSVPVEPTGSVLLPAGRTESIPPAAPATVAPSSQTTPGGPASAAPAGVRP
jgi:hypothetical protein